MLGAHLHYRIKVTHAPQRTKNDTSVVRSRNEISSLGFCFKIQSIITEVFCYWRSNVRREKHALPSACWNSQSGKRRY